MPEGSISDPIPPEPPNPTASALLRITAKPEVAVKLEVPGSYANSLVAVMIMLFTVPAPVATAYAAHLAELGAAWTGALILIDVLAAPALGVIIITISRSLRRG